jgi:hypothetical protein
MVVEPVATTDLLLTEDNEVSLFDLFLKLTLESVEQVEEELEQLDDDEELEAEEEEEEAENVEEVESLAGDSHWFFLERGKVPGGPIIGGASRCG